LITSKPTIDLDSPMCSYYIHIKYTIPRKKQVKSCVSFEFSMGFCMVFVWFLYGFTTTLHRNLPWNIPNIPRSTFAGTKLWCRLRSVARAAEDLGCHRTIGTTCHQWDGVEYENMNGISTNIYIYNNNIYIMIYIYIIIII
jgi:hypothetical protein